MRIRTVLTAAVLTAAATFTLSGTASAQVTDRDCRDFASQAAAQSALRSHSGDPERLDPDHDGVACEDHFRTGEAVPAPAPAPAPAATPVEPAPDAGPARDVPPPQPVVDRAEEPGVVVPPPGAPEDAPVQTVPEHQVLVKPHGAPDTGDGSATAPAGAALLLGGLGAVVALGAVHRPARRTR